MEREEVAVGVVEGVVVEEGCGREEVLSRQAGLAGYGEGREGRDSVSSGACVSFCFPHAHPIPFPHSKLQES